MEKSTVIGMILGIIAVGVGMALKGASPANLINPAAFLIIFVGTAASLFIGFPMNEIKKFPTLLKKVFQPQNLISKRELMELFITWANLARREGILALESQVEDVKDPFMKNGMKMIIDGNDSHLVQEILLEEIAVIEDRHRMEASIFTQAGTYAPTLGVLGAVIGLIAALGNLSDIEKLGHSIAAAFVATLLGIYSGYVLWHPIANKLKRLSKQEIEVKTVMVEGILSIQAGISSIALKQKLSVYLTPEERAEENAKGEANLE